MTNSDEDFTRRIAHDFNNVLMAISPFAELLSRTSGDARVTEYARRIRAALERGEQVTRELRARRAEPGFALDVQAALERLDREPASGAKLHLRAAREPVIAAIDDDAFRRLVLEILSYFLEEEKATRIFVSAETSLDLRYPSAGKTWQAALRLVHVKFRSQRTQTSPAPLTIDTAGEVARLRGGQILAEETDDGTVIHLFLPRAEAMVANAGASPAAVTASIKRVLIVEDDDLVAAGLVDLVVAAGIQAEVVMTPPETMAALERFQPEVVILDIHLGEFDGTAIYRDIAARFPAMPVVFSTGHAVSADFAWLAEKPHLRLLQKPYAMETLIDSLHRVVAAARDAAE